MSSERERTAYTVEVINDVYCKFITSEFELNQSHWRRLNFERFWKETDGCFLVTSDFITTVITPKLIIIHTYDSQSSSSLLFIWQHTSLYMLKMVYYHKNPTENNVLIIASASEFSVCMTTISHNALWTWTSKSHWTVNKRTNKRINK